MRAGKVTFSPSNDVKKNKNSDTASLKIKIAKRAVKEVKNGMNVNLGIGIPTLLPSVLPEDVHINLQS